MLKGNPGSGFCVPALIWAPTWVAASAAHTPAITNRFISPAFLTLCIKHWFDGAQDSGVAFHFGSLFTL
jgi:hypothetical protein